MTMTITLTLSPEEQKALGVTDAILGECEYVDGELRVELYSPDEADAYEDEDRADEDECFEEELNPCTGCGNYCPKFNECLWD